MNIPYRGFITDSVFLDGAGTVKTLAKGEEIHLFKNAQTSRVGSLLNGVQYNKTPWHTSRKTSGKTEPGEIIKPLKMVALLDSDETDFQLLLDAQIEGEVRVGNQTVKEFNLSDILVKKETLIANYQNFPGLDLNVAIGVNGAGKAKETNFEVILKTNKEVTLTKDTHLFFKIDAEVAFQE